MTTANRFFKYQPSVAKPALILAMGVDWKDESYSNDVCGKLVFHFNQADTLREEQELRVILWVAEENPEDREFETEARFVCQLECNQNITDGWTLWECEDEREALEKLNSLFHGLGFRLS